MIVNEVSSVFVDILKDLKANNVMGTLDRIQSLLVSRNSQNTAAILQELSIVRNNFRPLVAEDTFRNRSFLIRDFIRRSRYNALQLHNLAKRIVSFAEIDAARLPASGEVVGYINELSSLIGAIDSFIRVSSTLDQKDLTHDASTVFLVLQLPTDLVKGNAQ